MLPVYNFGVDIVYLIQTAIHTGSVWLPGQEALGVGIINTMDNVRITNHAPYVTSILYDVGMTPTPSSIIVDVKHFFSSDAPFCGRANPFCERAIPEQLAIIRNVLIHKIEQELLRTAPRIIELQNIVDSDHRQRGWRFTLDGSPPIEEMDGVLRAAFLTEVPLNSYI